MKDVGHVAHLSLFSTGRTIESLEDEQVDIRRYVTLDMEGANQQHRISCLRNHYSRGSLQTVK